MNVEKFIVSNQNYTIGVKFDKGKQILTIGSVLSSSTFIENVLNLCFGADNAEKTQISRNKVRYISKIDTESFSGGMKRISTEGLTITPVHEFGRLMR